MKLFFDFKLTKSYTISRGPKFYLVVLKVEMPKCHILWKAGDETYVKWCVFVGLV